MVLVYEARYTGEFYYYKMKKLPKDMFDYLYKKGKEDKRDYIKEFLELEAREVVVNKCRIYDKEKKKTKMYLVKGDIITTGKEQGDFIEFEYDTGKSNKDGIQPR